MTAAERTLDTQLDTSRRFVRLIERRADGFVEFSFSIGEPDLAVELLMSAEAFEELCEVNDVTLLPPESADTGWRLHDARAWTPDDTGVRHDDTSGTGA